MDLIEKIKRMNEEMNRKFPYINAGGCAKSSFTISKSLLKIKGVSRIKIVITWNRAEHRYKSKRLHRIKITDENILDCILSHNWDHIMVRFKYKGKIYYVDPLKIVQAKDLEFMNIDRHYGAVSPSSIIKVIRKCPIKWNKTWASLNKDNEARLAIKRHLLN